MTDPGAGPGPASGLPVARRVRRAVDLGMFCYVRRGAGADDDEKLAALKATLAASPLVGVQAFTNLQEFVALVTRDLRAAIERDSGIADGSIEFARLEQAYNRAKGAARQLLADLRRRRARRRRGGRRGPSCRYRRRSWLGQVDAIAAHDRRIIIEGICAISAERCIDGGGK
jgi:hypothetical protein